MNILINGGSKGIGREIALRFSEDRENKVIITGRSMELLDEIAGVSPFRNIYPVHLNLESFEDDTAGFLDEIGKVATHIDILVNNAGALAAGDFLSTPISDARSMMEVNFFSAAIMIKSIVPMMKAGGHIVNISSMGGYQGSAKYRGLSYYSASKAAIASLTECLAGEFADAGISVNCLALGAVATEMLKTAFPGYKAPVTPVEMAEFITYFARNGSKFFNGKIIPVALSNP